MDANSSDSKNKRVEKDREISSCHCRRMGVGHTTKVAPQSPSISTRPIISAQVPHTNVSLLFLTAEESSVPLSTFAPYTIFPLFRDLSEVLMVTGIAWTSHALLPAQTF
jgi:hypothetical protein